jgi:hypothetical protein
MSDIVLRITAEENRNRIQALLEDYLDEPDEATMLADRLATEYVAVDDLDDLQTGRYVRWIYEGALNRGAIVLKVEDDVDPPTILCKTGQNRFIRFRFDDCPCFMKLNQFEAWYLNNGTVITGPPVETKEPTEEQLR